MNWNHYHVAQSIEDALFVLSQAGGDALPMGGGTDLLLDIQQGHHSPVDTIVDLTQIPEMTRLEFEEGYLRIGGGVPVSRVAESDLVRFHAPAVTEACALIGGPQVRNTATLGGNVAHALPAADGMISLVAMNAQVEVASDAGRRWVPILSLFRGPGQSALDLQRELIVSFRIQAHQGSQGSGFSRVMRPQGVALPILNMAAWVQRKGELIEAVRIAVGPAGPTPQRAGAVEDFLTGAVYGSASLAGAAEVWQATMRFRSSPQRASADYRMHLSGVLFQEVMQKAWQRSF